MSAPPPPPPPEKKGLCHNINPGLNHGILRYQTCFKSYHAYTTKWNPKFGKFLKTWLEPENEFCKFAVAAEKCDVVDGHLSKRKTSRFAKTISFLLCRSNESPCKRALVQTGSLFRPERLFKFLTANSISSKFFFNIFQKNPFLICQISIHLSTDA